MIRSTNHDVARLKSQFATSNAGRGGTRKLPLAFTEHGAIMAATILSSRRAIEVSVYVVRAFVQMRETLAAHKELAKRLDELETVLAKDSMVTTVRSAGLACAEPACRADDLDRPPGRFDEGRNSCDSRRLLGQRGRDR